MDDLELKIDETKSCVLSTVDQLKSEMTHGFNNLILALRGMLLTAVLVVCVCAVTFAAVHFFFRA